MGLTSNGCYNKIVCNQAFNVTPTIEYSNPNICEYNYISGLITPLNLGTTTITVKFVKNNVVVSNSFSVKIEEIYRTIETNLTKEADYYILLLNENKSAIFSLAVYEGGVINSNIQLEFQFISNVINASVVQYEFGYVVI